MDIPQGEKLPAHLRSLADLGRNGDLNMRPVLFRVVCDLFAAKTGHSRDQLLQFEAIALPMMTGLEDALLEPVAARLATHPETPPAILHYLLGRSEALAVHVFALAAVLDRNLLLDGAHFGSAAIAAAIAGRRNLDQDLVQFLSERPEDAVVLALLANAAARFGAASQGFLIRRARHSAALARAVAGRDDFAGDMTALFLHVPQHRRAAIMLAARRLELGAPQDAAVTAAQAAALQRLERLAMVRDWSGFANACGAVLGCTAGQAELLLHDRTGEPLALALAATGMDSAAAARIFMCLDPEIAHSVDRVHGLAQLVASTPRQNAARLAMAMLGLSSTGARLQAGDLHDRIAREWPSRPQLQGSAKPVPLRQAGETARSGGAAERSA